MSSKMKNLLLKNNISQIQKICLSGLFIALIMIFNKVVAINYIPVIPFVRISFGGIALLIFSSFFLGPLYGMVIGVTSDLLGYFIFDPKTFGLFPQITLIYLLLGILPYFLFSFIRLIKSKKTIICLEYIVFAVIFALVTIFLFTNNTLTLYGKTHELQMYQKILIVSLMVLFFALLIVFNFVLDKKQKAKTLNVYHISFVTFITELFIVVLFGSLMKATAFGFDMFYVILITQGMLMFLNVPLNTYLVLLIMRVSTNFYKGDVYNE